MALTAKQEEFARAFVETRSQAAAYRCAYSAKGMSDNSVRVEASRLMDNPNVTLLVEKMQERHQKRHDITIDKLTSMAVDAYDLAMKDSVESPAAAVSAVTVLGKLHGLIVDKTRNEHLGPDGLPLMPSVHVTISRPKT